MAYTFECTQNVLKVCILSLVVVIVIVADVWYLDTGCKTFIRVNSIHTLDSSRLLALSYLVIWVIVMEFALFSFTLSSLNKFLSIFTKTSPINTIRHSYQQKMLLYFMYSGWWTSSLLTFGYFCFANSVFD